MNFSVTSSEISGPLRLFPRSENLLKCHVWHLHNYFAYADVVIGAPYEDDGKGAVYVYHGSRSGLQNSYAQVSKVPIVNIRQK